MRINFSLVRRMGIGLVAVGITLFMLAHLRILYIQGEVTIVEHNPYILWAEIVLLSMIVIIGIWQLIDDFRQMDKETKRKKAQEKK